MKHFISTILAKAPWSAEEDEVEGCTASTMRKGSIFLEMAWYLVLSRLPITSNSSNSLRGVISSRKKGPLLRANIRVAWIFFNDESFCRGGSIIGESDFKGISSSVPRGEREGGGGGLDEVDCIRVFSPPLLCQLKVAQFIFLLHNRTSAEYSDKLTADRAGGIENPIPI